MKRANFDRAAAMLTEMKEMQRMLDEINSRKHNLMITVQNEPVGLPEILHDPVTELVQRGLEVELNRLQEEFEDL